MFGQILNTPLSFIMNNLLDDYICVHKYIWDKVFKNVPSKICGRQPSKNFTWTILEYFVPYIF